LWKEYRFTYDVSRFTAQSLVAVEVSVLGYQMGDREPSYSFGLRCVYHLGGLRPSGKRKGGCVISTRRLKGARFVADPSSEA
jgi:hypothetical protein